jgi:sugar lactone lactonase YvrE
VTDWSIAFDDLAFPEGLRWHGGALHLSDIFAGEVLRLTPSGREVLARVAGNPSGIGWLPDGTLLAVSMLDRRVVAVRDGEVRPHADLSEFARSSANDMLVDGFGRAYVGDFGYDYVAGEERKPARLCLVQADGTVSVAAEDVWFPNGMALTPDGNTLLLAETPAQRISAFTVGESGALSDRRVFAALEAARPDGISLDASGAVWLASPRAAGSSSAAPCPGPAPRLPSSWVGRTAVICMSRCRPRMTRQNAFPAGVPGFMWTG